MTTPDTVVAIIRQALEVAMLAAGPMLLASLLTGLLISVFQAATQINEMTLTFIPKILVMFIVLVITGPLGAAIAGRLHRRA
jgi:flagellar biosynthesis protein FliQ